uniref:Pentacotripeptide-repeat region of PRORP domain-containing protein n=1 Tax=Manihot esculenta TaxID=3983 RepID=A0A2C9UUG5_MANES
MKNKIEQCGVKVSQELVQEVLSRVRNDWEAAFTFFLWAGRQPGYVHSVHEYNSMISILAKMRKFDTAWSLIDEMRGVKTGVSLVVPQTLLIMIRRYCAVHDVGRAINTFYAYKRFKFDVGIEEFQSLLSALCRYKNVQDAEHLMFSKKDVFPFNTKSFNIVLNGWSNFDDVFKLWNEMSENGISPDRSSYIVLIHGLFLNGKLEAAYKYYTDMKQTQLLPDPKIDEMLSTWLSNKQMAECRMTKSKGDQSNFSQ